MSDSTNSSGPGVWPGLLYQNAPAAQRFLIDVFGFTEALTVRGEDAETIVHAELRWPEGGGVMFGSARDDDTEHAQLPTPSGVQWVYVVTSDPDAVHERAVRAGATVLMPPYDTDYGSRNVSIADPQGNSWTFGTYPGS